MSEDWDEDDTPGRPNEIDREWQLRRELHFNVNRT